MARTHAAAMGTSAYDLDRLTALPELTEDPRRSGREGETLRPRTSTRAHMRARKRAARQSISGFAIMGGAVVCIMLLLVVLSHMQLAMISTEMGRLDRQASSLRTQAYELQIAHDAAFSQEMVETFARGELGMVDATPGQIVIVGSNNHDVAEVLYVATAARETGIFTHLMGLLREYLPFLSS